jgi:hypothetical protein
MTDYRKPTDQLVFDLIEESNPGFKTQYDVSMLLLGTPVAFAAAAGDPYKRDTKVMVSGKPGSGIVGKREITYRRINIKTLMNGMPCIVSQVYEPSLQQAPAKWRAEVNRILGVNIPAASWSTNITISRWDGWVPGMGQNYTVTMGATDLCYYGAIGYTFVQLKRTATDLLGKEPVVNGRLWPGGNNFGEGSKPRGEFLAYGMDFSEINNLAMVAGPVTINVGANNFVTDAILARLQAQSPEYNWANLHHTTPGGILGTVWTRVALPNAAVPEANPAYKYCWYIPAPTAGSWWVGKLIFHFNDQVV